MNRFAMVTLLGSLAVVVPAFADDGVCSWVGTASACREKAVGSVCTDDDGYAGVCATTYWDHCACAKLAGRPGSFRRDDDEVTSNKCSWVGSHDGCRDGRVGDACSRNGRAGVCARSHWDRCDCAAVPGGRVSMPSGSVKIRGRHGTVVVPAPGISISVPGFSFESN